jgi:hypothetical protein
MKKVVLLLKSTGLSSKTLLKSPTRCIHWRPVGGNSLVATRFLRLYACSTVLVAVTEISLYRQDALSEVSGRKTCARGVKNIFEGYTTTSNFQTINS